ncbi:unnamed protein product [Amoebophrya sp. A25]|nr:unnamed protein product [Amoebophrya sp. A25]|eukprot:GSA25T00008528001.1
MLRLLQHCSALVLLFMILLASTAPYVVLAQARLRFPLSEPPNDLLAAFPDKFAHHPTTSRRLKSDLFSFLTSSEFCGSHYGSDVVEDGDDKEVGGRGVGTTIIELGCHHGHTSAILASALKMCKGKEGKLILIDKEVSHLRKSAKTVREIAKSTREALGGDTNSGIPEPALLRLDSLRTEWAAMLEAERGNIGLILIDGNHDESYVRADAERAVALKPRFVLFDDALEPGVRTVIKSLFDPLRNVFSDCWDIGWRRGWTKFFADSDFSAKEGVGLFGLGADYFHDKGTTSATPEAAEVETRSIMASTSVEESAFNEEDSTTISPFGLTAALWGKAALASSTSRSGIISVVFDGNLTVSELFQPVAALGASDATSASGEKKTSTTSKLVRAMIPNDDILRWNLEEPGSEAVLCKVNQQYDEDEIRPSRPGRSAPPSDLQDRNDVVSKVTASSQQGHTVEMVELPRSLWLLAGSEEEGSPVDDQGLSTDEHLGDPRDVRQLRVLRSAAGKGEDGARTREAAISYDGQLTGRPDQTRVFALLDSDWLNHKLDAVKVDAQLWLYGDNSVSCTLPGLRPKTLLAKYLPEGAVYDSTNKPRPVILFPPDLDSIAFSIEWNAARTAFRMDQLDVITGEYQHTSYVCILFDLLLGPIRDAVSDFV